MDLYQLHEAFAGLLSFVCEKRKTKIPEGGGGTLELPHKGAFAEMGVGALVDHLKRVVGSNTDKYASVRGALRRMATQMENKAPDIARKAESVFDRLVSWWQADHAE